MEMYEKYMSKKQICDLLDVSLPTVNRWIAAYKGFVGSRYPSYVLITDGKIVRVQFGPFLDFVNNKKRLLDRRMCKYVPAWEGIK